MPNSRESDESMESALTTCIDHFTGHEDARVREIACKLAKSVELITNIVHKPLIDAEDISHESALTSSIGHFREHKDDRIREAACKLDKLVEPITDIVSQYWK